MKNIHILPTDKPIKNVGDLVKDKYGDIHIFTKNDGKEYGKTTTKINIYITNDEEIKERDWFIFGVNESVLRMLEAACKANIKYNGAKKIILTTDQDLIKDGVQAIDDEFLEWFVQNPSCEEVDNDTDFKVWDELFGILAWKFQPTKSGDMFLDAEKVFEELKSKFKLEKL